MTVCEIFFKLKFSKFIQNIRILESFSKFLLIVIYWTLGILTLISFINDWFMAWAIRAKWFVKFSTTTIAKIIKTFKWVQVVITDAISYQICDSSTLVIVKSGMFKSWQEVPIELPYARHYKPRLVYFLPTFWSSFMYCDLWPYVWLINESGFKSRAAYGGARTVYHIQWK